MAFNASSEHQARSKVNKQAKRPYPLIEVDGIINIDKPYGLSSNQVLQKVKSIYKAKKAGHTGNLDPLATGVLPICFGHATKVSQLLLDSDKCYIAGIILGANTTTGDKEGEVIGDVKSTEHLTKIAIEDALLTFQGKQMQMPPMFSALKYQGQPLYKLARQGIQVERTPRKIEIYDIELLEINLPEIMVKVCCSKGTYIRTLAEDIGAYFNLGAHLSSLRRTKSGIFNEDSLISLEKLNEISHSDQDVQIIKEQLGQLLLPMDSVLTDLPKLLLDDKQTDDIKHGRQVPFNNQMTIKQTSLSKKQLMEKEALIRLYNHENFFLGLGLVKQAKNNLVLQPKRLFINNN